LVLVSGEEGDPKNVGTLVGLGNLVAFLVFVNHNPYDVDKVSVGIGRWGRG
jgi:hypothetical protein